jgi:hypothetical protein
MPRSLLRGASLTEKNFFFDIFDQIKWKLNEVSGDGSAKNGGKQ